MAALIGLILIWLGILAIDLVPRMLRQWKADRSARENRRRVREFQKGRGR